MEDSQPVVEREDRVCRSLNEDGPPIDHVFESVVISAWKYVRKIRRVRGVMLERAVPLRVGFEVSNTQPGPAP